MASARQKCGKWYYRITVTVGDGSHKYIERGSFRTKKEALTAGRKAELLYKDGDAEVFNHVKAMTFDYLVNEWLEASRRSFKAVTIDDYRKILSRFISPKIGSHELTGVSYKQCQDVIDAMVKSGHAISSIRGAKVCLNLVFKYALHCGYLKKNPAKDVELPSPRSEAYRSVKDKRNQRSLTKKELDAIFERFPEGHPVYIPLILGYRCGLRIGEAFGLLIEDIDFKRKQLHIRRQIQEDYYHKGTWYFTPPKYCRKGEGRDVDLDAETLRILKRHVNKILSGMSMFHYKTYYEASDGRLNDTGDGKVVNLINVRYLDGSYVSENSMIHASRIIHGKYGKISYVCSDFHFHMLRHTHASDCLAAGMSATSVQKRLGHKQLETTMRYYAHETEVDAQNAKKVLEKMYL